MPQAHHLGQPVDMARDDVPAKLVPDLQRALEVHPLAGGPAAEIGLRQGFGRNLDVEPALGPQSHHRQADPVAGDGGADVDARHVIARRDPGAQVAGELGLDDPADIGDNSGEHPLLLLFP